MPVFMITDIKILLFFSVPKHKLGEMNTEEHENKELIDLRTDDHEDKDLQEFEKEDQKNVNNITNGIHFDQVK